MKLAMQSNKNYFHLVISGVPESAFTRCWVLGLRSLKAVNTSPIIISLTKLIIIKPIESKKAIAIHNAIRLCRGGC